MGNYSRGESSEYFCLLVSNSLFVTLIIFKDNVLLVCSVLIKMNKINFAMFKCLAKIIMPQCFC